jgi:hypothetical protein
MMSCKLTSITIECPCLEELRLDSMIDRGSQVGVWRAAATCPRISTLVLSRCKIDPAQLIAAYHSHSITQLDISYSQLFGASNPPGDWKSALESAWDGPVAIDMVSTHG